MKKVLVIVDMQKDFCEGGSLSVNGGNGIVSSINKLKDEFLKEGNIVVASREMHPSDHKSFASQNDKNPFDKDIDGNTFWPDHCIVGTIGSEFNDNIDLYGVEIFTKGKDIYDHPFSAFGAISDKYDLWLNDYLTDNDVEDVYVVGLALEFCVLETIMDSVKSGFKTSLYLQGTSALTEDGKNETIEKLKEIGVSIIE